MAGRKPGARRQKWVLSGLAERGAVCLIQVMGAEGTQTADRQQLAGLMRSCEPLAAHNLGHLPCP